LFEHIDPQSPTPLYEQIAARIRVAVAAGELESGAALPSVRYLAQRLRVNPATVVQAYRSLETDGFVEMRHGSGTFIRPLSGDRLASERMSRARQLVRQMLAEGASLGISGADLSDAFRLEMGDDDSTTRGRRPAT
jgi:GntR family transcriptional regulator